MKNRALILFVFSAILFFHSADVQAATIRISAPKIELDLSAGETYTGEIVAENPSDEPLDAKIYLEDWEYMPSGTGEKKFLPSGTTPLSAGPWITFSPAAEKIDAFGRITARYTIAVPPDAKGSYFSVLFFETILGGAKDEEGVNVLVAGRIGALFLIHIKDAHTRDGKIKAVNVKNPQGNEPLEIETTFENTGNIDITLGGNFLIMDQEGKVMGRGDINKIYTFPGTTVSRPTQWVGKLAPGEYQLLLTYDLGKGKSLVEERTLTI